MAGILKILPPLYTVPDLAAALRITEKGVRQLLKAGRLPSAKKVGRRLCWSASAFDAWLTTDPAISEPSEPATVADGPPVRRN